MQTCWLVKELKWPNQIILWSEGMKRNWEGVWKRLSCLYNKASHPNFSILRLRSYIIFSKDKKQYYHHSMDTHSIVRWLVCTEKSSAQYPDMQRFVKSHAYVHRLGTEVSQKNPWETTQFAKNAIVNSRLWLLSNAKCQDKIYENIHTIMAVTFFSQTFKWLPVIIIIIILFFNF